MKTPKELTAAGENAKIELQMIRLKGAIPC